MKQLLFAFMLLASLQSNGQKVDISGYFKSDTFKYLKLNVSDTTGWLLSQSGHLLISGLQDSLLINKCRERGHVWQISESLSTYAIFIPEYVLDSKDTSWLVTPCKSIQYQCRRCYSDSTCTEETKKIIWIRKTNN